MKILSLSDKTIDYPNNINDSLSLEMALEAISKMQTELQLLKNQNDIDKNTISVKDGKESHLVKVDHILYLEAKSNYCYIMTKNKKTFFTSKTLKYWEERLPETLFIRCHKSIIVNIHEIMTLNVAENNIQISNNCLLTVSRDRKKIVKERFKMQNATILRIGNFI